MKYFVLALALVASNPAYACHRFSHWAYPWAQHCRVSSSPPAEEHSWYVEMVLPPLETPPPDQRTPDQIRESLEHDQAVAAHKDELNKALEKLKEPPK